MYAWRALASYALMAKITRSIRCMQQHGPAQKPLSEPWNACDCRLSADPPLPMLHTAQTPSAQQCLAGRLPHGSPEDQMSAVCSCRPAVASPCWFTFKNSWLASMTCIGMGLLLRSCSSASAARAEALLMEVWRSACCCCCEACSSFLLCITAGAVNVMHCKLRGYPGSCNPLNRCGRPFKKLALVKRSATVAGSTLSSPYSSERGAPSPS